MTRRWTKLLLLVFLFSVLAGIVHAQQSNVLDNGLVRLAFDQHTGLFEAHSLQAVDSNIFHAGPGFVIGGKSFSPNQATKIEVSHQDFTDQIGHGQKLIVSYSFGKDVPTVRYELAIYSGEPWISIVAYLSKGNYSLYDFSLVRGDIHSFDSFKTRVYVNEGRNGGDSGVWPLGLLQHTSSTLSVLYDTSAKGAVGLGFYSFYRASSSVITQYLSSSEIGVNAVVHYYGYQPKIGELKTESLLLNFGADPLKMLDDWINAAVETTHPVFNHDTRRGFLNSWYIYGSQITENDIVHQTDLLRRSILPSYGITSVFMGEWQHQHLGYGDGADTLGYGEDEVDPRLFPRGIKWLSDNILAAGLQPVFGANYASAAPHSQIVLKHVPWIDWDDFGMVGHPIDYTNPDAQQWLYNLARRTQDYKAVEWWDDFDGGPAHGVLHDRTQIMQFEDVRDGIKTIRRAIGSKVSIHKFCCGPYFSYWGLVDRVRMAIDAPGLGDWEGFKSMARQLAANYMLNQRAWITDPDPLFVGGRYNRDMNTPPLGYDPSLLQAVRIRLQEQLISGGPVTIGENLEDLDTERLHLLTLVLPTYGESARPLDLFVHVVPEIYDLKIKTNWDDWHVLLIQNWNEESKQYKISFSSMGLAPDKYYLVYRFWDRKLLGVFHGSVPLDVNSEEGQTYAVRLLPFRPAVLSDDMNLTQGAVELSDVQYVESTGKLSGIATRHPGDLAHIAFYVPREYSIGSASGTYRIEKQSSGASVAYLEIKFDQNKSEPWSITFDHTRDH